VAARVFRRTGSRARGSGSIVSDMGGTWRTALVAAAVAAALGGCTGIGSTPTAATTSACDAARAAFQAGINTLPTPAPSSDAAQMGQYRTQLGSALQIVVGNPTCFDPQLSRGMGF
jgi:hypothetical protein